MIYYKCKEQVLGVVKKMMQDYWLEVQLIINQKFDQKKMTIRNIVAKTNIIINQQAKMIQSTYKGSYRAGELV